MSHPHIPAKALRPRRFWYIVAALIVLCGVLAAVGMAWFVPRYGGDLGQPFLPAQPVIVRLSPSASKVVWVKDTGTKLPSVECDRSSMDGQQIRSAMTLVLGFHATVEHRVGDQRWRGLIALYAEPAGRYAVTCRTSGTSVTPTLSIGDPPRFYEPGNEVLLNLAAFGVAAVSTTIGLVVTVIVAGGRSLHRARLGPPVH